MVTLVLQCLVAVATLAFGLVALAVARRVAGAGERGAPIWWATGFAFVVVGASGVLHNAAAVWAYLAGPGSRVYDAFLVWSPVANHGRNGVALALGGIAMVLALRPRARARWAPLLGGFLLAHLLGGLLGWQEGSLRPDRHYVSMAALESAILVLYLAALLAALVHRSMDRLCWLAFALLATRQALSSIWVAALAWFGVSGAWVPSNRHLQLLSLLLWLGLIVVAWTRLRLARRGVAVPDLLDAEERRPPTMLAGR